MAEMDQDREERIKKMQENTARLEKEAQVERDKAQDREGIDREVEQELQTARPGTDAPSRANITPDGSGADAQRG
jgi:hypothetical protein